ncbi:unnamed protein product, partial [Hapterophycus canaliculatus]
LLKVAHLLSRIPSEATPKAITAALGDALGESLPAYDRIMIYRFREDKTGEVIHESIRSGFKTSSSYLNLRFPATDIPPEARELLQLSGVRFIADASDPGVPMILEERGSTPLDLSMSAFRAPTECHLGYLRNMGVKASLVVPIAVDGELWGLCSCHSYTRTVHPSCEERFMAHVAATITASLVSHSQREEVSTTSLSLSNTLDTLSGYRRVNDFLSAEHEALMRILGVDTIVLCERSRVVTVYGNQEICLTLEECKDFLSADGSGNALMFRATQEKGVAFFSVRYFLVAFLRGNVAKLVNWAGNPDPPTDSDGAMHPRASFDLYMQTAKESCKSWSPETIKLLGTTRRRISSFMYGETLPADLEEAFAYMSHELRTPFHGILGALEILEAEHGTIGADEKLDIVRSALRCSESMMSTLDEIVNIAKDQDHKVARDRFAVSDPIMETVASLKPFAATESVDLILDIPPATGGREVVGDVRRIRAVVQNLVNNAVKFTPSGGKVRISLAAFQHLREAIAWWVSERNRFGANVWMMRPTEEHDENDSAAAAATAAQTLSSRPAKMWYVYCVEDSGVGVPPLDLPHIGDAFTKISDGASRSYTGTGLGLHISQGHAIAMSGGIGVASTTSGEEVHGSSGTLFAMFLPLRNPAAPRPKLVVSGSSAASRDDDNGTVSQEAHLATLNLVFLAVDDNIVNLKLIARKIAMFFKGSRGDVEVRTAADGIEALDALMDVQNSTERDDALLAGIFLDFHMPNLDGIECTKRIRKLENEKGWPRIFICGCSADPTQQTSDAFQAAGGSEVIYKPWKAGQVEGMCTAMLAKASEAKRGNGAA